MKDRQFYNRVIISRKINSILYYLRKIPILKKLIKNDYKYYAFKNDIGILQSFIDIITEMLFSCLKIVFPIVIFFFIFRNKPIENSLFLPVIASISVLLFTIGPIGATVKSDESKLFTRVFKIEPRSFYLNSTFRAILYDLLFKLIVFCIFFRKLGLIFPISLVFINKAIESIFTYISLRINANKAKSWIYQTDYKPLIFYLSIYLLTISAAIYIYLNKITNIYKYYDHIYLIIISIIIFVFFIYKIYTFEEFEAVNIYYIRVQDEVNAAQIKYKSKELSLNNKEFNVSKNSVYENLNGVKYLNRIFFKRFFTKFIKKSIFTTILFSLSAILIIYIDTKVDTNAAKDILDKFIILIPFIMMYSKSNFIIETLYYNCDRALLRFGFYKEKNIIFINFLDRIKYMFILNMILVIPMIIILLIYFNFYKTSLLISFISSAILIIIVEFFISIFFLAYYFIFQPYNLEAKVKNPVFYILRLLPLSTGLLGPIIIKLGFNINYSLCLIYISLSLILIYLVKKISYKNFKNR